MRVSTSQRLPSYLKGIQWEKRKARVDKEKDALFYLFLKKTGTC